MGSRKPYGGLFLPIRFPLAACKDRIFAPMPGAIRRLRLLSIQSSGVASDYLFLANSRNATRQPEMMERPMGKRIPAAILILLTSANWALTQEPSVIVAPAPAPVAQVPMAGPEPAANV